MRKLAVAAVITSLLVGGAALPASAATTAKATTASCVSLNGTKVFESQYGNGLPLPLISGKGNIPCHLADTDYGFQLVRDWGAVMGAIHNGDQQSAKAIMLRDAEAAFALTRTPASTEKQWLNDSTLGAGGYVDLNYANRMYTVLIYGYMDGLRRGYDTNKMYAVFVVADKVLNPAKISKAIYFPTEKARGNFLKTILDDYNKIILASRSTAAEINANAISTSFVSWLNWVG